MRQLDIRNLKVEVEGQEVLKGLSLFLDTTKMHVLMGPNGSGKSSLAYTLMGHPSYQVTQGEILIDGQDISELETHERARLGLFLSFQNPVEIPGLTVGKYLKRIKEIATHEDSLPLNLREFIATTRSYLNDLGLPQDFLNRYLNEGFSGGEKKRMETLQLLTIAPYFSLLDEIDSGLDIDALKNIARILERFHQEYKKGSLIITHQYKMIEHLSINSVYVLKAGKLVAQGDKKLAQEIEKHGYEPWQEG